MANRYENRSAYISAEDIASETIVRSLKAINSGAEIKEGLFRPFTLRIAKNYLIDLARQNSKEIGGIGFPKADFVYDGTKVFRPAYYLQIKTCEFQTDLVEKLFAGLKTDESQMLSGLYSGISSRELAQQLEITEQSARKRLSRLRKKLRNRMQEYEIENRFRIAKLKEKVHENSRGRCENPYPSDCGSKAPVSDLAHTVMSFPSPDRVCASAPAPRFWIGNGNWRAVGETVGVSHQLATRTACESIHGAFCYWSPAQLSDS